MKILPTFGIALVFLAVCGTVLTNFRQRNTGVMHYERYFSATPPTGYGLQRSLVSVEAPANDLDQSILQQGILYHQAEDYDLALTSLRAYLESNPAPADHLPQLLATTAALATGHYGEAAKHLEAMPQTNPEAEAAAVWFSGLLDLRAEKLTAARSKFQLLSNMRSDGNYPVDAMLEDLGR